MVLSSGGGLSGTPTVNGIYTFTVQVKDSSLPQKITTKQFTLNVVLPLIITTSALASGTVGENYSQTLAASGGVSPYSWVITAGVLPAGIIFSSATGTLSGIPTISSSVWITFQAKDLSVPQKSISKQLLISIVKPLVITTASLSNGTVGVNYSQSLLATGGVSPYTWSITSGALPAGIVLTGSVLSGKPTVSGTFPLTVQVKDSSVPQKITTKQLSILVNESLPLIITTASLVNGMAGRIYSQTLAASGGISPYTWSISDGVLPLGLGLNASTGVISGTPTKTGTATFTVQAKDSSFPQKIATKQLSITIASAQLSLSPILDLINKGFSMVLGWTAQTAYAAELPLENTVATATTSAPTITNYTYDPSGQRIIVSNETTTTVYPTKNYNTDGTNAVKHIFAGAQDIATIQGTGADAVVFYNSTDSLNSSSIITDSTGAIVETMDYFPFGGIRIDNKTSEFSEQRKYIGQEYDAETGLNYLNARYYNAATGRFISEDPVFLGDPSKQNLQDPQSLNSYSYANNNPIRYSDPLGLFVVGTGLIQKGDTLNSIASKINTSYGTSYTSSSLAWANGISNPNLIKTGSYINYVPGLKTSSGTYDNSAFRTSNSVNLAGNTSTSQKVGGSGAVGLGLTGSAGIGAYVSGSALVQMTKNDVGFTATVGTGGSSGIMLSGGGQVTVSNAKIVRDLQGTSLTAGASGGPYAWAFGADYSHDPKGNGQSISFSGTVGPKTSWGVPAEIHGGLDYTWAWHWFNWSTLNDLIY